MLVLFFLSVEVMSAQSSITKAQGEACKTAKHTKLQIESQALLNAKRQAVEFAKTYVKVQTQVTNFELEKDIIKSFSEAEVKVLSVNNKTWDDKQRCYSISIMAEIFPVLLSQGQGDLLMTNPTAPLTVKVWTDQAQYHLGQYMKIYIKGNKPFYGRLTYKDASGNLLQILPNVNRSSHHFNGSVTYQVPDIKDNFELLVEPPLGLEKLTLYASTAPLGKIEKQDIGGIYKISQSPEQVGFKTRGIRLITSNNNNKTGKANIVAEFDEAWVKTEIIKN
ncbi:DUF4384 domain-containing protein [Pseudoalteromonas denitrificans]|nr:DUF4384 domain-containing protein [Pseudoalteromonas denitrificans]